MQILVYTSETYKQWAKADYCIFLLFAVFAFYLLLFFDRPAAARRGNKRFIYNIHCVDLNNFAYI